MRDALSFSATILPDSNKALGTLNAFQQNQAKLDAEKQKQAAAIKIPELKVGGWNQDTPYLQQGWNELHQAASQLKAQGIDPISSPQWADKFGKYAWALNQSEQHKKTWEDVYNSYQTNYDNLDPRSKKEVENWLVTYKGNYGDPNNLSARAEMTPPQMIMKSKPIPFDAPNNAIAATSTLTTSESGDKTVKIKAADKKVIEDNVDAYFNTAEGQQWAVDNMGGDIEASKDFWKNKKIGEVSKESSVTYDEAKSGLGSQKVQEDFDNWYQDFVKGKPEAGSYLYGITLPDGTKIEKANATIAQPEAGTAAGAVAKGSPSYTFITTTNETSSTPADKLTKTIEPNSLDKQEAKKLYMAAYAKGGKTKYKNEGQFSDNGSTGKTATRTQIKSLVGTEGYEGYTEQELIDYYKSQGYDITE